jgi:hypothetical protein
MESIFCIKQRRKKTTKMYNIQRSPIIALNEKQSKWELFLHQITDEKTTEHIDPTTKN